MKSILTIAALALTAVAVMAETPIYLDSSAPIEKRVDDALSRMTLEEKVALLHAQGKFSSAGVPRLGIPELWMSDGPHGVRAEINWNDWGYAKWTSDSCTAFPALTALAATWNPALSGVYGKNLGEEALYRGKNVMLGPGVNIYRTPLNGRNFEYMGEDPYLAGEMVVPYIKELQKNGVAACVKHYALNNQEKWRGNVDVKISDRALYEIYLPAFEKAVRDGGSWSIMGSYNKYDGSHACHNKRLLCDILRDEWGFDGVVITDWGGCHDTREAALYGLDLEMGSYTNGLTTQSKDFGFQDYYLAQPYLKALKAGELPDSTVNAKAANVLRLIFRTAMNTDKPFGSLASDEHYAAAKEIGDESIVLMKNDGILPLDPAKVKRVLVVGENATRMLNKGGGSSELKVKDMFSPLEALKKRFEVVDYTPGYKSGRAMYSHEDTIPEAEQAALRAEAVMMAPDYDAVIYIGGLNKNAYQDCEASDRREYNLPWSQDLLIEQLAEANPNLVVANITGNAYAMPWLSKVPAVVQSWYLGTMIGPSMADVLTGAVNPSGKLPFTFPVKLSDNGAHSFGEIAYPGIEETSGQPREEYLEDILVGYRWHDTKKIAPLFPFGHGLSYTSFEYSNPSIDSKEITEDGTITLTVPVTNTGKVEGMETVQLYIGDDKASVLRPLKELKGFRKISLKPGETAVVTFTITPKDLKFFDDKSHSWKAEPGSFKAYIGSSSGDIRATMPFRYK
ncbi:MAG: glycoside hydrolase family 3 C-terminal domain-containing protein [Muribaculaceae bacterium]|nr:glycoside hydrolase family 3 C-terminal domain-containing protein [Muribaculaceae bacterium]